MKTGFETLYPAVNRWIEEFGWIEIGADEYSTSLIRVLDEGGMVWEIEDEDVTLHHALMEANSALEKYIAEELGM